MIEQVKAYKSYSGYLYEDKNEVIIKNLIDILYRDYEGIGPWRDKDIAKNIVTYLYEIKSLVEEYDASKPS